jgi:hypothetical protein
MEQTAYEAQSLPEAPVNACTGNGMSVNGKAAFDDLKIAGKL